MVHTQQVDNVLQAGVKVENINNEFKLTTIKPIHANTLQSHNLRIWYQCHYKGMKISWHLWCNKNGKSNLSSLYSFNEITLLGVSSSEISNDNLEGIFNDLREGYVNEVVEHESEEYGNNRELRFEGNFKRNTFDYIIDDE